MQSIPVIPRPNENRDMGRLKDTALSNRKAIVGELVVPEQEMATKIQRRLPEYTRFN